MKSWKSIKTLLAIGFLVGVGVVICTPQNTWAATRTWDGGAGDNNLSTAANWSSDVAPVAGDDLVFPANITDRTITNDFSAGTSFNSIAFTGSPSSDSNYTLSGNSITLVNGITNSMSATGHIINNDIVFNGDQTLNISHYIVFEGVLSGSGNLTKTGTGSFDMRGANTFSGTLTANAGNIVLSSVAATLGSTAGNTQINDGASMIVMIGFNSKTIAEPIVFSGGPNGSTPKLSAELGFGPITGSPSNTVTFSGATSITSDLAVNNGGLSINLTTLTTNGHAVTRPAGSFGTLTINGTVFPDAAYFTETLSGSSSDPATVGNHSISILEGSRGDVTVYYDGVLKGTGTVGELDILAGGKLATGQSPGCIASSDLTITGTLDQEIAGTTPCSGYDQLQVTGTVTLSGALTLSLLGGFTPAGGQVYTIILNDGSDAVSGTFNGLAEGAMVSANGYQFRISYVGGDGNDVTLTPINVPGTPNTGGAPLIASNPVIVAGLGVIAAVCLTICARKYVFAKR